MTLNKGTVLPYYLNEEKNWELDITELEQTIKERKDKTNIRGLVVINPGNPTGQVLSKENIADIISLCYKHSIAILADEVYSDNIYEHGATFYSFRRVLGTMPEEIAKSVELFSINSISKGVTGECGLRGGYMEVTNIEPEVQDLMYKMKSIELCANTVG